MPNPSYQEHFAAIGVQVREQWAKCLPQDRSPLLLDSEGNCNICRPWQDKPGLGDSWEQLFPDGEDTAFSIYTWLERHKEIVHTPQTNIPKEYYRRFIDPTPEVVRGITTYYDPAEVAGTTDFSKAFFLLNGHRLGTIEAVQALPLTNEFRSVRDAYTLSVIGANRTQIALSGCTTGYRGEGSRGTLYVLRLAGFPDGDVLDSSPTYNRQTNLENIVFTQSGFRLTLPA